MKNTRRKFLKNISQSALYVGAASTLPGCTNYFPVSANTALVSNPIDRNKLKEWIIFDGLGAIFYLNDIPDESKETEEKINQRIKNDVLNSGITAIRYTVGAVHDVEDINSEETELYKSSIESIEQLSKNLSETDYLTVAYSVKDIEKAKQQGQVAITFGFQNCHMLGSDLSRVDTFRDLGVLTMQLTYNGKNQIGGGSNVDGSTPLTKFGHEAIYKMNDSNVLIDLSHSGQKTCLDALAASKRPMTISHSGCRALVDFPRNKTDKEMRLLADNGGVFGLYFMPFLAADSNASSEHLIWHLEHALKICGEDHVAIGTDGTYTGVDDLEATRAMFDEFTQKRIDSGSAAAGEKIGNVNFLPDIVGPDQFLKLANSLAKRGHSERVIEKILGRNVLRLAKDVWGS